MVRWLNFDRGNAFESGLRVSTFLGERAMRPPSFRLKSSYNDLKLFTIGVDFLERLYGDRLQKRWPCRRCRSVRCQGGSDVKVGQATRRNRAGVEQACIDLRQASVTSPPFPDGSFTRALALHSIYFWPSIDLALRELYRVLRPSGRLAIGSGCRSPMRSIQPRSLRLDCASNCRHSGWRSVPLDSRCWIRRSAN